MSQTYEDRPSLAAWNALAQAVGCLNIVEGTYIGDGTNDREFDLGFRPKLVILAGFWVTINNTRALAIHTDLIEITVSHDGTIDFDSGVLAFTDTGFKLLNNGHNINNLRERYLAFP